MFKKLFLGGCLGIIIVNFSQVKPMGIKDIITSDSVKAFCATSALLAGAEVCSFIALYEMKRKGLGYTSRSYKKIIRKRIKPALVTNLITSSVVTAAAYMSPVATKYMILPLWLLCGYSAYNHAKKTPSENLVGGDDGKTMMENPIYKKKIRFLLGFGTFSDFFHLNLFLAGGTYLIAGTSYYGLTKTFGLLKNLIINR